MRGAITTSILALILVVCLFTSGCGSGTLSASNPSQPVNNGNPPSPTPTPAGNPSPTPTPSPVPAALVTRFAYMVHSDFAVHGFSVNADTGTTTALPQGPVTVGTGFTTYVAADKLGRFLYVVGTSAFPHGNKIGQDEIGMFRINSSSGNLTAIGPPILLDKPAGSIVISPDSKFLYMAQSEGILVFSINQNTGSLTKLPGSPFVVADPNTINSLDGLSIAPSGNFLYIAQDNISGGDHSQISVYALDPSSGIPKPAPAGSTFEIAPAFFADPLAADPLGRFIYTGGLISGPNLDVHKVQSTGALSVVPGSPFPTDDHIWVIAPDPTGRYLYAISGIETTAGIYAFSIDQISGALTPVAGSPFASSKNGAITVDQTGKFLFMVGATGTNIELLTYEIDPSTGALTLVSGNPADDGVLEGAVTTVAY